VERLNAVSPGTAELLNMINLMILWDFPEHSAVRLSMSITIAKLPVALAVVWTSPAKTAGLRITHW
jgi:hypothetical protein